MNSKHSRAAFHAWSLLWVVAGTTLMAGCASMVEATATPESMGVSTAQYRGYNCDGLAQVLKVMDEKHQDTYQDPLLRKTYGWHGDAIRQVQQEKGCSGSGPQPLGHAAPPNASGVPMYLYCYATDTNSRKTVSSLVFQRGTFGDFTSQVSLVQALQSEFKRDVLVPKGIRDDAVCVTEDSLDKALRSREKHRSLFSGLTLTYIDVSWNPQAQPSSSTHAAPSNSGTISPNSSAPPASLGIIGIRMGQMTDAIAQGLGMPRLQGVLVIEVMKGMGAEHAGLRPMDVVLEFAGQAVSQPSELQQIITRTRPGFKAPIRIWRDMGIHDLVVEVQTFPLPK